MGNVANIKGVFNAPPAEFMTSMTTGAALLGNGDLCVAVGGASDQLAFRLSKVDFWQARDGAPNRARARAIGTLTLNAPALKDTSYLLEQRIQDATLYGSFDTRTCGSRAIRSARSLPPPRAWAWIRN